MWHTDGQCLLLCISTPSEALSVSTETSRGWQSTECSIGFLQFTQCGVSVIMPLLHTGYCTNLTRSNKTVYPKYLYLCAPSSALSLQWLLRFQVVNNGLVCMCYIQVLCLVAQCHSCVPDWDQHSWHLRQFLCKRQFLWFAILLLYIHTVGTVRKRRMGATSLEELVTLST